MAKLATNIDLVISGMRMGARDPTNPYIAAVGEDKQFYNQPPSYELKPKVLKERPDMAGGFKIPEEILQNRNLYKEKLDTEGTEEIELQDDSNIITKDEIIKELNLTSAANAAGEGSGDSLTKRAMANELVDSIAKELEKLRRQGENIQTRKNYYTKERVEEETEAEKNAKIKAGLEDKGCNVIHAEEERVQAQRHQTGQLGGLGAITMEEVMEAKKDTQDKLRDIELDYYRNKDSRYISELMRQKLKEYNNEDLELERERRRREKDKEYYEIEAKANAIREEKAFKASSYNPERTWVRRIPQMKDGDDEDIDEAKLLAKAKKEFNRPPTEAELKRMLYEAKFAKYRVNRKLKEEYDSGKKTKEDFDLYLRGKDSSHIKAKGINWDDLFAQKLKPAKYSKNYDVYQSDFDLKLLETIRNKLEKLSKEDKLTFSILKWIFNALKKKDGNINRKELVEQLDQNIDILQSLGFESTEDVEHSLSSLRTKEKGKLRWEEFLDFFGSRTDSFRKTGEAWWKTEQEGQEFYIPINDKAKKKLDPKARKEQLNTQAYEKMMTKPDGNLVIEEVVEDPKKEAKMKKLAETRLNKLIVEDIENELNALKGAQRKRSESNKRESQFKTTATIRGLVNETNPEMFKTGPECTLQNSHMQIMHEVYDETDRFNEQIVKITDLVDNLRESKTVQKFLDNEAVKIDRKTRLTVEDVLKELKVSNKFAHEDSDNEYNSHDYLTWDEFVDFFDNYQTPEQRLKSQQDDKRNRITFKTEREKLAEMKKQIEEEKDRRLEDLPRFREDDIIDCDEQYLDTIFDIFDKCVRHKDNQNLIDSLEFFMELKKDPKVIKMNETI